MRFIYLAIAYLLPLALYAQNIPDSRKVDWSICGVEGGIPCQTSERNAVTEFGIDNTGSSDVSSAVNSALSNLNEGEVLYFPSGTYLFNSTVNVPQGVVIRGESPVNTVFRFNFSTNATCFKVTGAGVSGNVLNVTDIGLLGEYTVTVDDASGISIGEDVEIAQANDPAIHGAEDPADLTSWAEELKGQIAKVVAKNGNMLTLDRSLTYSYDLNFAMTLKKVSMISGVGLESFKLVRVSDNGTNAQNNNFWFTYSKNCWMRRVHSEYSSRYHVRVDFSSNFEMSECFLDKAFNCGGGGAGYGVLIQDHATECLIENNIARALRHPWIPKEGAARNVYAYNFSSGTTQGTACDADPITESYADISLHGHYPSYNLFEGNIVYRVTSSDAWGPNGPGNTIFRNRVLGAKGIWIQAYSKEQNVIGNELTFSGADFEMDRDGTIGGTTLNYSNYSTAGLIDGDAPQTVLNSYYLTSKPDFFNGDLWPSIGPGVTFNSGEIPAQKRFNSGNYFSTEPLCSACELPKLGADLSLCGQASQVLDSKLSATGRTFQWFRNGVDLNIDEPSISVSDAGTYKVVVDSSGCITEDEIVVSSTLPAIDLGGDQELCKPSIITLQSSVVSEDYSYTWEKDGSIINGESNFSLTVMEEGTYTLTIEASGCNAVSDQVAITSELLEVEGDILCESGEATVNVNGTGDYEWFDALEGGNSLGTGTQLSLTVNEDRLVYVEDKGGFSANVGHVAPDFSNGRTWDDNQFDRKMTFEVLSENGLTIDSVSVWPAGATQVVIRVLASDNSTVLKSKSFSSLVQDAENRLFVNFDLSQGTYFMDLEGTNGNMYYSNENDPTIAYPYTLSGLISIIGAEPAWITAKPYFMYAYNWHVSSGNACDRTPVSIKIDPGASECVITSSKDRENAISFSAFPNPFSEELVIEVPEAGTLSIVDAMGRVVDEVNVQAGTNHIRTGNESGLYQLIYRNSKGQGVVRIMRR